MACIKLGMEKLLTLVVSLKENSQLKSVKECMMILFWVSKFGLQVCHQTKAQIDICHNHK